MNNDNDDALIAALRQGRTVLVASRRAARAAQLAYAQDARRTGRLAWRSPDVLTVGAWLERTFQRHRGSDSVERLLPTMHVTALWDRIVRDSPLAATLVTPGSAARHAERAWTRAVRWGVPMGQVAADPADEPQALAAWTERFSRHCDTHGWLPAPLVARWLMDRRQATHEPLLIAQPAQLAPLEKQLFRTLAACGDDVQFASGGAPQGRVTVCGARDSNAELAGAADWARRLVEGGATAVGIVVPDLPSRIASVRRAFEDVFVPGARNIGAPEHHGAFEIAAARSLEQFPIVRSAFDLLELVRGRSPPELVGRVLRSAFIAGSGSEAAARALLDLRMRSDGRERIDLPALDRLAASTGCARLAERLLAVRAVAREFGRRDTPSVWAERFLTLLTTLGWPGERPLDSDERQTVEKLRDSLGAFGALDEILGRLDADQARSEFMRIIAATNFEPRTRPAPVTVIDPETVIGMRFEALWLAGMDSARWPPPPDPDPFLPVALQAAAGMPWATAAAAHMHARGRLDALLASAPQIVASWPQWDGDAEQRPSPWLIGWPVGDLLEPGPRAYRHTLFQSRPQLAVLDDAGAPPLGAARAAGGSRVIELQAACPFRAQAELRLHARPVDEVGPDVDPLERGQLAHRVLDDLWREFGDQAALQACDPNVLEARVSEAVERRAQPLLSGASAHRARLVAIEVELTRARILELLEVERGRAPFRVHDRPELTETLAIGGIELDLRIDRVDELDNGERVVIDYKTGASANPGHWYGERLRQPQLPVYALAHRESLAAVAFAVLARGRVGFEGIARSAGVLPGIDAWPANTRGVPAADWPGLLEHWHVNVERLAAAYSAGESAVDPLPQACRYCHLSMLCRVHETDWAQDDEPDGSDD